MANVAVGGWGAGPALDEIAQHPASSRPAVEMQRRVCATFLAGLTLCVALFCLGLADDPSAAGRPDALESVSGEAARAWHARASCHVVLAEVLLCP